MSASTPPPPYGPRSTWHSVETLVVVLAVITMAAVVAGVFARACGGGRRDVEGWVESRCRSCLDGGVPPPTQKPAGEANK